MSAVPSCLQENTEAPKDTQQTHLHPKTEYNSNIIIHAKPWDYNPLATYMHSYFLAAINTHD